MGVCLYCDFNIISTYFLCLTCSWKRNLWPRTVLNLVNAPPPVLFANLRPARRITCAPSTTWSGTAIKVRQKWPHIEPLFFYISGTLLNFDVFFSPYCSKSLSELPMFERRHLSRNKQQLHLSMSGGLWGNTLWCWNRGGDCCWRPG